MIVYTSLNRLMILLMSAAIELHMHVAVVLIFFVSFINSFH